MNTIIKPSTPLLIEDLGYLYPKETSKQKKRFGLYKCSCGKEFKTQISCINSGNTTSCGCYQILSTKNRATTHGLTNHRLYNTWCHMISRVENQKNKDYKDYGGRGIAICEKWRKDFMAFYDWAISNGYSKDLTIDRINVNGNYEPLNCRFTTPLIQARNTQILRDDNTSGYRGVYFNKNAKKWKAQISVNKKRISLGTYLTAMEAAKIYDNYVIKNKLEHTRNF